MASQEWEKPKAVVIPSETGHLQQGKYGPIFPKTPACYGFTIIAKVKPGTAETIRNYGNRLAKALEGDPYVLRPSSSITFAGCCSTTTPGSCIADLSMTLKQAFGKTVLLTVFSGR